MERSYDVVIAGGGVNGCSSACFLCSDPDFTGSVAVIERDPTYRNAPSARATGGIRQQFSTPENIQIGQFGAHFVKHIADYLTVGGTAPEVNFRENGFLLLANAAMLPVMQENHAVQLAHHAAIEFHDPAALAVQFPWLDVQGLSGGFFGVRNEGWLDPYQLLQAYRAKAKALGAAFIHDEVVSVDTQGRRATAVRLASGRTLGAGAVLNAAGASGVRKLARSAGVDVPIESRKRFTFVFETREPIAGVPLTILPEGLAFRPEGNAFLANMAPSPDDDPETFDYDIDHRDFDDRIWPLLASRVPAFEAIKQTGAWCCHYDLNTFDENAIVGRLADYENLYVLTGFSGHGLQQSPAMGRAISELIVHGEYRTIDLRRFDYHRIAANRPVRETNCY